MTCDPPGHALDDTSVTLDRPAIDRLVIFVGIPAVVLVIGLLTPWLARLLLRLHTGLPFGVVFRVLGAVDRPPEIAVHALIWLGLGLGLAWTAGAEEAIVRLNRDRVHVLRRGIDRGLDRGIDRADVQDVFLDGRELVVLDRRGRQRLRTRPRAASDDLRRAFVDRGYPWREVDPYAARFRRWDREKPPADLPPSVVTLLRLRQAQLDRHATRDVDLVREALDELGIVVRDEGTRQYWRPLAAPEPGSG